MEKAEKLEILVKEEREKLLKLEEDLLIQKMIDKLEIKEVKNNFLENVQCVKLATFPSSQRYVIVFEINRIKKTIEFEIERLSLLGEKIKELISQSIYNEIIRQIKVEI